MVRNADAIRTQAERVREYLLRQGAETRARDHGELLAALINRDILLTQLMYLNAMEQYLDQGGGSRGSYLVQPEREDPWDGTAFAEETLLDRQTLQAESCFVPVRPLPEDQARFESVYNDYRTGHILDAAPVRRERIKAKE